MVASTDMLDKPATGQENVSVNAEEVSPSNPSPPGAVSMQNHMCEMLQMMNAQFAQADPCRQHDLMTMQKSVLARQKRPAGMQLCVQPLHFIKSALFKAHSYQAEMFFF
jgi:hypothetical protein